MWDKTMNNYNASVALKVANMSSSNIISIAMKNNRQDFSPQFSFAQTCLHPGSSEHLFPGGSVLASELQLWPRYQLQVLTKPHL